LKTEKAKEPIPIAKGERVNEVGQVSTSRKKNIKF
jgi:hypothetical protein